MSNINILEEYEINKILIIRNDRLGDVIISEPFFRYFKGVAKNVQIDVLLGKRNINSSWIISDYIDNTYCYSQNIIKDLFLLKKLKKNRYDLVIDLKDKVSRTSNIIIKSIKAKYSAGFKYENIESRYDFEIEKLNPKIYHICERTSNLLNLFGLDTKRLHLDYKINFINNYENNLILQNSKPIFIINLSGSSDSRNWGEENYIKFINLVKSIKDKYQFMLIHTKNTESIAKNISIKTNALVSGLISSTEEYAFILSKASIILSPDTSAIHFASAFKIKTIALYNFDFSANENFEEMPWLPFKTEFKAFGSKSKIICDIKPETVLNGVKNLI